MISLMIFSRFLYEKAASLMMEALSIEPDHAQACSCLGLLHAEAQGVQQNFKKVVELLEL